MKANVMSDKFKKLFDLIQDTNTSESTYVYFTPETGKINKIGTKTDTTDFLAIQVDPEDVKPIMNGKARLEDYRVVFDKVEKEYKLQETLAIKDDHIYNVLHEVPYKEVSKEQTNKDIDLVIVQDLKEKCWKLKLGDNIRKIFERDGAFLAKNINLSVTAKHDPNIFYKTISVNFGSLLSQGYEVLPFHHSFEHNGEDVSIFTSKIFETFLYEKVV